MFINVQNSCSDAKMMVARLQEILERKNPDDDDKAWSSFFSLLDGLKVFFMSASYITFTGCEKVMIH